LAGDFCEGITEKRLNKQILKTFNFADAHQHLFTSDPSQLSGETIKTILVKGNRGLGFTLIGNDSSSTSPEFLQIKSIIHSGPAFNDNKLRMGTSLHKYALIHIPTHTGDILVYINNECVLGATQEDAIRIFQSIPVGEQVSIVACRGYPLLFDPMDEIVRHNACVHSLI
jgi:atrophin-1 interacting protein 1